MKMIRIFKNQNLLAKSAAYFIYSAMQDILARKGEVSFIISGDIELPLFYANFSTLFNSKQQPKTDIYWFLANESWASPASMLNRGYRLRNAFFSRIRPPEENIFSWQVMYKPPYSCARCYNDSIENFFTCTGKKPDITLLTMDEEGNIAALFPGSKVLVNECKTTPLSPEINQYGFPLYYKEQWYMSVSPFLLNQSGLVIVFILGKDKQGAFKKYLERDKSLSLAWLNAKELIFYLDRAAAGDFIYKYAHKKTPVNSVKVNDQFSIL